MASAASFTESRGVLPDAAVDVSAPGCGCSDCGGGGGEVADWSSPDDALLITSAASLGVMAAAVGAAEDAAMSLATSEESTLSDDAFVLELPSVRLSSLMEGRQTKQLIQVSECLQKTKCV